MVSMIAMTMSNSMSEKPDWFGRLCRITIN
jgi:hypothetical protein